jgi:hypothetical protein
MDGPVAAARPPRVQFPCRDKRSGDVIYEIRTYRVKVGSIPEVEKRFGEAYEYRKKISPLAAFWHTEIVRSTRSSTCGRTRTWASGTVSGPRR